MKKSAVEVLAKGAAVGGTMLVPGVSGGSMAMILGAYDQLVSAVASFTKHKRDSILFLGLFSLGGILGMVLFARPILFLIQKFPMVMLYFFTGAVAGGIPMIVQKARVSRVSWKLLLYPAAGMFLVVLAARAPSSYFADPKRQVSAWLLVLAGVLAAVALVLPGISVSYFLLLLGLYDKAMRAIAGFDLSFLFPLGVGLLLGILLCTKLLERAMERKPQITYLLILGFILGSVAEIFPGAPSGWGWLSCILAFGIGFGIILAVSSREKNIT